jgi:hypothetical protein
VKLVPPELSDDGKASVEPVEETIVIATFVKLDIGPVMPLTVA